MDKKLGMKSKFNFDNVKNIPKSRQNLIYGYIKKCQDLFPSNIPYYNIPKLIDYIILFYYNSYDVFSINDKNIFKYIYDTHKYAFHIYSKNKIKRGIDNEWKYIIKTSKGFGGCIGIMDDTDNNGQNKIKNGESHSHQQFKHVTFVGTYSGNWSGCVGGIVDGNYSELTRFIYIEDTITIIVNYKDNIVSFKSLLRNKEINTKLKNNVKSVRLIIEFGAEDCTIQLFS